jgi:hypothetical protein
VLLRRVVLLVIDLAGRDAHDLNRVADHVSGRRSARGPRRMASD